MYNMERIKRIMEHPLYRNNQSKIEKQEQERIFCKHGLEHSLDVARIMYILILEQGLDYSKDVVYGTAILHDIGRGLQYEENRPHHEAGADLAGQILKDCGYDGQEIAMMVEAILSHHTECDKVEKTRFSDFLYQADKLSRACYKCKARKECYWDTDKMNMNIQY